VAEPEPKPSALHSPSPTHEMCFVHRHLVATKKRGNRPFALMHQATISHKLAPPPSLSIHLPLLISLPARKTMYCHPWPIPFQLYATLCMLMLTLIMATTDLHKTGFQPTQMHSHSHTSVHIHAHVRAQYVNRAAVSVRSALKEPAKSKLAVQGEFHYKASAWAAGEQGPKVDVTTFAGAGK